MKYYTGKGDKGETIFLHKKIKKSAKLVKAVGDLDELNTFIGFSYSLIKDQEIKDLLKRIEYDLYQMSSEVAGYKKSFTKEKLDFLEKELDKYSNKIEDLHSFIYPNGNEAAVSLNLCRAICRRAERSLVEVTKNQWILAYINRLSSLFFVLFRYLNKGSEEIIN